MLAGSKVSTTLMALLLAGAPLSAVRAEVPGAAPAETSAAAPTSHAGEDRWVVTPRQRLIARVIFAEACDEPLDGKIAVASVILNRLTHPDYPHDLEEVIYQPNAFSCFWDNSTLWQIGGRQELMTQAHRRRWNDSMEAAKRAMLGEGDTTIVAYRHVRLISERGYWGRLVEVATIGRHRFYTHAPVSPAPPGE